MKIGFSPGDGEIFGDLEMCPIPRPPQFLYLDISYSLPQPMSDQIYEGRGWERRRISLNPYPIYFRFHLGWGHGWGHERMGGAARILVADEDARYQGQIVGLLTAEGFDVRALGGSASMDALEQEPFAVVVVSLRLTGLDPLLIVRRARELNIPCLAVAAGFYDHEAREACQLGADSVWVHPLDVERFTERIRAVLAAMPESEPMTVLLIDDTADTRRVLRRMLERDGLGVLEADRGTEGIRLAMSHRVHLIVLDVNMPGLDGLSVCEILKTEPATSRIPILVCTVRMENEDQLRAASVGADGFLGKPFSSERLLAGVHRLLESKTKDVPQES